MKVCFLSEGSEIEGMKKGIKYNQDQSSIMLLLELNFRHNAVVLRVTLKGIMLKFSSIMYLTLPIAPFLLARALTRPKSTFPSFERPSRRLNTIQQ